MIIILDFAEHCGNILRYLCYLKLGKIFFKKLFTKQYTFQFVFIPLKALYHMS